MEIPKMILFDYGHTLLYEPDSDFLRGEQALFKYIKSNKRNLSPQQVVDFSKELFNKIGIVREAGLEIHEWQFQRFLYEYLEIELSISHEQAEEIFWYHVSPGKIMPDADKVIDYINSQDIRSGVISNISFSGDALSRRINRLLPGNKFEFIIASSDYMFRKPNSMLFELALRKANLQATDVWFCGDNPQKDIEGAWEAGIFPVWYDNDTDKDYKDRTQTKTPLCDHIYINKWQQIIDILKDLKKKQLE